MPRVTIYFDDDKLSRLKHLAAEQRQSVADLVREAVDAYLAKRLADQADWRARFDQLFERVQSRIPATIPPEEIEADISAAREDVRRAHRRAARRR